MNCYVSLPFCTPRTPAFLATLITSYPIIYNKQEKGTEKESPTILIQEISHDNSTSYNPWNKSEALNFILFFKSQEHRWFLG